MTKLIICIDGLGYDLVTKENMPFLWKYGKENSLARLKTLFAFTGIEHAFFSGKNPSESGIWLEFIKTNNSIFNSFLIKIFSFNRKLRDYAGILVQLMNKRNFLSSLHNIPQNLLGKFDISTKEGLWKLDFFKNHSFSFYKWPFSVNEKWKKIIFSYENDEERLKRLLKSEDKEIYYTQLMEIDKAIHKFGKNSLETKKIIEKIDKVLEKYIKKFENNNNKNAEIILWSDHGFANVKNFIDIEKILPERKDYIYFIAGTTVSFWFDNQTVKEEIIKKLKTLDYGEILNKKTAKKYKIPLLREYGELVFYVKKGDYFFPNYYQKYDKFKAMHGYPDDKELDGFLITNKKKNLKTIKICEALQ